ncbi:MAG: alpha/beta hydrolase [Bacteroidetes bacterium]|nr:MAG: alpha/beta hydrolase [Bacteroidota bacterium]PTM12713.1 MAG: alpha/beta hydrolase [Bacteroidota bacterium]
MTNFLTVPGLGNSGPDHWQTIWERSEPRFQRIGQADWQTPRCQDWIACIDRAVAGYDPATVVLVGHSLGCLAIAHWAQQYRRTIKGALLVAPVDTEGPLYESCPATGFESAADRKMPFKTLVVTSADDPWVAPARAAFLAQSWGSTFVDIGPAGHLNAVAGYGNWDEGRAFLRALE